MKGTIFTAFERFVEQNFGADFFEEVLDSTETVSDGVFVGPETYPDADLFALVGAVCDKKQLSIEQAMLSFGNFLFIELVESHRSIITEKANLREFLKSVDDVIHVEVKKLYPDAYTPKMVCRDTGKDTMEIIYRSKRNLPDLFEGLVQGAAKHYDTQVEIRRSNENRKEGEWLFCIKFCE